MGMTVGGSGAGPKADINMTPMIDVLLVLIIIFMVITPLTPKGLEALVPQPPPPNQKQQEDKSRTVVITSNRDKSTSSHSPARFSGGGVQRRRAGGQIQKLLRPFPRLLRASRNHDVKDSSGASMRERKGRETNSREPHT